MVGADTKWVDNVLSHYAVVGVEQGTRGVQRQLNDDALLAVALCRLLAKELGVPVASAVRMANDAVQARSSSRPISPGLELRFALDELERRIRDRVSDAVEAVAHVRRGRPRRTGSSD